MNCLDRAIAELKRADHEMTVIYQGIIRRYSKEPDANPTLVENLRTAQRAWIAFRDAHIQTIYPDALKNYWISSGNAAAAEQCKRDFEKSKQQ